MVGTGWCPLVIELGLLSVIEIDLCYRQRSRCPLSESFRLKLEIDDVLILPHYHPNRCPYFNGGWMPLVFMS